MNATATCEQGIQMSLFTREPERGVRAVFVPAANGPDRTHEAHRTKNVQPNSLAAHDNNAEAHRGRKWLILGCIKFEAKPMHARQILRRLFPESDDINLIRPRLTELVAEGKLIIVGDVIDEETNETVSLFWLA